MKTSFLSLSALALAFVTFGSFEDDTDEANRKAVEAAVLDYVEGIYEVEPARIERSVHPDLKKYGYWREGADQDYRGMAMTYAELVDLAGQYNKDGRIGADAPKEVEIHDVLDQTASAKLTAAWGIDYMQLAKVDGTWKILHVLWQSHP